MNYRHHAEAAAKEIYGLTNLIDMYYSYVFGWLPVLEQLPDVGPGKPVWEPKQLVDDRLGWEIKQQGLLFDQGRIEICLLKETLGWRRYIRFTGKDTHVS